MTGSNLSDYNQHLFFSQMQSHSLRRVKTLCTWKLVESHSKHLSVVCSKRGRLLSDSASPLCVKGRKTEKVDMLFCRGMRSNRVILTSVKKDQAGTSGATLETDTGTQSKITYRGDIMLVLVQCKNIELALWWICVVFILWDFRPKVLKTVWGWLKIVLCSRSVKARGFLVTVKMAHTNFVYLFHSMLKICGYKNHTLYF